METTPNFFNKCQCFEFVTCFELTKNLAVTWMLVNIMIEEIEKKNSKTKQQTRWRKSSIFVNGYMDIFKVCFMSPWSAYSCELKRGSYTISFVTSILTFLVNKWGLHMAEKEKTKQYHGNTVFTLRNEPHCNEFLPVKGPLWNVLNRIILGPLPFFSISLYAF